jgi:uncharacterized membrane protein HdeD (DUF308 family)
MIKNMKLAAFSLSLMSILSISIFYGTMPLVNGITETLGNFVEVLVRIDKYMS